MVQQKDKSLSRTENRVYKEYIKNGKPEALLFRSVFDEWNFFLHLKMQEWLLYMSWKKLANPSKSISTDCVTLKTLWIEKKIPLPYSWVPNHSLGLTW